MASRDGAAGQATGQDTGQVAAAFPPKRGKQALKASSGSSCSLVIRNFFHCLLPRTRVAVADYLLLVAVPSGAHPVHDVAGQLLFPFWSHLHKTPQHQQVSMPRLWIASEARAAGRGQYRLQAASSRLTTQKRVSRPHVLITFHRSSDRLDMQGAPPHVRSKTMS